MFRPYAQWSNGLQLYNTGTGLLMRGIGIAESIRGNYLQMEINIHQINIEVKLTLFSLEMVTPNVGCHNVCFT